jgi:hypothetical protein
LASWVSCVCILRVTRYHVKSPSRQSTFANKHRGLIEALRQRLLSSGES